MGEKYIVIAGPSGSGKSSLASYIQNNYEAIEPICFTTRKKRDIESDNYEFVSNDIFNKLYQKNFFFFCTGKNDKYGFSCPSLYNGEILIILTSYKNAIRFYEQNNDSLIITLYFDNIEQSLQNRIAFRTSASELQTRLQHDIDDYKKNFETIKRISSVLLCSDKIELVDMQTAIDKVIGEKYCLDVNRKIRRKK